MSSRSHRHGARSPRARSLSFEESFAAEATGHRPHRLEAILLEELRSLVRHEAADPALAGVVLVSLRLSVDGGHARVAYAVVAPLGEAARVERVSREALARATGFLRARLASVLVLKKLPTLGFAFVGVADPGVAAGPEGGGDPWLA